MACCDRSCIWASGRTSQRPRCGERRPNALSNLTLEDHRAAGGAGTLILAVRLPGIPPPLSRAGALGIM
jgi:hypothetical protein